MEKEENIEPSDTEYGFYLRTSWLRYWKTANNFLFCSLIIDFRVYLYIFLGIGKATFCWKDENEEIFQFSLRI